MARYFERWRENSPANNDELRKLVERHCKLNKHSKLSALAQKCDAPNLSKWLHRNPNYLRLTPRAYAMLVFDGITHGWLGRDPGSFYRDLHGFMGNEASSWTEDETHYVVFRFSYLAEGWVLRGSLTITRNPLTNVLETKENYLIQAPVAKRIGLGYVDAPFPRSGFFVPRGRNSYLMLSRKDDHPSELQTAYLEADGGDKRLHGPFSDWHGEDFYSTHMVALKRQTPLPRAQILTITSRRVPDVVMNYLTIPQKLTSNMIVFMRSRDLNDSRRKKQKKKPRRVNRRRRIRRR